MKPLTLADAELTAVYREANGELTGKAQPLTTQRIFRAMRAMARKDEALIQQMLETLKKASPVTTRDHSWKPDGWAKELHDAIAAAQARLEPDHDSPTSH